MNFKDSLFLFLSCFVLFVPFFILTRSLWTLLFFVPFLAFFFINIKGGKTK